MVAENENIEISTKSVYNPYENVKGFVKDLARILVTNPGESKSTWLGDEELTQNFDLGYSSSLYGDGLPRISRSQLEFEWACNSAEVRQWFWTRDFRKRMIQFTVS